MKSPRTTIAALSISGAALVGILTHEGFRDKAYIPVPGDVPTVGFGTTDGVKMGDSIDPVAAVNRAHRDIVKFENALKQCVKVPLYQHEFDAYTKLTYNIGSSAFCGSTLVRKLNAGDYTGACKEILRWDRFQGKPLRGLTNRRQEEYKLCLGLTQL